MGEREVEAPAARPATRARGCAARAPAPCRRSRRRRGSPTDLVREPEPVEDPDRLPVLARGDLDLVPALAQALDDRPQDERVRRGRAVDPDPHRSAKLTASERVCSGGGSQPTPHGRSQMRRGGCPRRRCWSQSARWSSASPARPSPCRARTRSSRTTSRRARSRLPTSTSSRSIRRRSTCSRPRASSVRSRPPRRRPSTSAVPSVTVKVPQGGLVAIYAQGHRSGQRRRQQRQRSRCTCSSPRCCRAARRSCSSTTPPADQVHGPGSGRHRRRRGRRTRPAAASSCSRR